MIAFQFFALVDRVAYECAVTPKDIFGKSRKAEISDARGIAIYCTRRMWGISYPRLGALFGGRSHVGAMYLVRKTEGLVEFDARIARIVNVVMESETT